MIEAIQGHGAPRAKAVCDECGREEVVPCGYDGFAAPKEGQVLSKLKANGWTFISKKLRCPKCEAARKAKRSEKPKMTKKKELMQAPSEMDIKSRREINRAIMAVWDEDNERYQGAYTDRTVADEIGVRPGWVKIVREENYGGSGGNDEFERLLTKVEAFEADVRAEMLAATAEYEQRIKKKLAEHSALKAQVERAVQSFDLRMR